MAEKVLIVLENLSNGGAQRVIATLLPFFPQKGEYHLLVLTKTVSYPLAPEVMRHVTVLKHKRMLYALPRLLFELLKYRHCTIFSTVFELDAAIYRLRQLCQPTGKLVFRSCNFFSARYPKGSRFRKAILTAYKNADTVISTTVAMHEDLDHLLGDKRGKHLVINNPIDIENLSRLSHEESHRIDWVCKEVKNPIVFCIVAKLKEQKNIPLFLKGLAMLPENCRGIIIGKGPLEDKLKDLVQTLGLQKRLKFLGFLNNPYPLMASSDVLVLSSDFEGFPNVIIEGMALGLPIISTDCPSGPSEIIRPGRNGFLVPVGDAQELSDRMQELANDDALRVSIRKNNLEDVKAYSAEFIAMRFWEALTEKNNDHITTIHPTT